MKTKIIKSAISLVLMAVIILSIVRISYFGEFIDAVFFTYLFGWFKYIAYLISLYVCAMLIFDLKWHTRFFVKNKIIGAGIIFLSMTLLFSLIAWWANGSNWIWDSNVFQKSYTQTTDHWLKTSWPHRQPDEFFSIWGGGIIGNFLFSFIAYTSTIGALLITIFFLVTGFSIYFKGSPFYVFKKIFKKNAQTNPSLPLETKKRMKILNKSSKKESENINNNLLPTITFKSQKKFQEIEDVKEVPQPPRETMILPVQKFKEQEELTSSEKPISSNKAKNDAIIKEKEIIEKQESKSDPRIIQAYTEEKKPAPQPKQETSPTKLISEYKPKKVAKIYNGFKQPDLTLLKENTTNLEEVSVKNNQEAKEKTGLIENFLKSFDIDAHVVSHIIGPRVTKYEIELKEGVRVIEFTRLEDDIKLALKAKQIRIEAPIPGKSLIGIEIPNENSAKILFKDLLQNFNDDDGKLVVALGKDTQNKIVKLDIKKMPHLLVAGATGSGKSVSISSMITSLIIRNNPGEVKLVLIDPKKVELQLYDRVPHLLTPIINNAQDAAVVLKNLVLLMEQRYDEFAEAKVRNIDSYNEQNKSKLMPYIVIFIDELADLMVQAKKEVESSIMRLTQMARAAGMHIVVATQRPSVDIVTGVIKSNIPSRIAFAVASQVDSRTILDAIGAEKLLGKGDMLFAPAGSGAAERLQACFLSDEEIDAVVSFCAKQAEPDFDDTLLLNEPEEDENDVLYSKIKSFAENFDEISTAQIQDEFKISYAKAKKFIDKLEVDGLIGEKINGQKRQVF